jgi:hypothetical protein
VALLAIGITGTVIGVTGNVTAVDRFMDVYNRRSEYSLCMITVYVAVLVPFACAVLALVFGACIAVTEGWTYFNGFLYVASNIAGVIPAVVAVAVFAYITYAVTVAVFANITYAVTVAVFATFSSPFQG